MKVNFKTCPNIKKTTITHEQGLNHCVSFQHFHRLFFPGQKDDKLLDLQQRVQFLEKASKKFVSRLLFCGIKISKQGIGYPDRLGLPN